MNELCGVAEIGYRSDWEGERSAGEPVIVKVERLFRRLMEEQPETGEHCQRVRELSEWFAREVGLSEKEIRRIGRGALLHDIGKLKLRRELLLKKGRLTLQERGELSSHAERGVEILEEEGGLGELMEIVNYHHERWDGMGYPMGLKGDEIPYGVRVVSVVDSFDAMVSERVYKEALSEEEALEEIGRGLGTQFDPELGGYFIERWQKKTPSRPKRP